jgi:hypothetical protein
VTGTPVAGSRIDMSRRQAPAPGTIVATVLIAAVAVLVSFALIRKRRKSLGAKNGDRDGLSCPSGAAAASDHHANLEPDGSGLQKAVLDDSSITSSTGNEDLDMPPSKEII